MKEIFNLTPYQEKWEAFKKKECVVDNSVYKKILGNEEEFGFVYLFDEYIKPTTFFKESYIDKIRIFQRNVYFDLVSGCESVTLIFSLKYKFTPKPTFKAFYKDDTELSYKFFKQFYWELAKDCPELDIRRL